MQPDQSNFDLIRRIARKEITLFFASPIAYLFLATFAAVTLFVFFWGEAFFSRNIADVRPLFEWMPLLLIFLASTLTMRLWSEERRTGTLEYVLTQPVHLWVFVLGKFLGCLLLLAIALAITLPLPITVSLLGDLDWGPVWAGYLATFLLGATYLSIGLFISARSENQIVSLISAVLVCSIFYLIGTPLITDLVGNRTGEWLRLLGTGSRFESITRGVIDLRDLYYYLSLIAVFLTLNTYMLEKERWATSKRLPNHKAWRSITALLVVNALVGNLWLGQITALRVDATEGNQYSISDATKNYLDQLQEPLLLRGYFSSKTHPLLAPLVPQLRDLMREYEIAGGNDVRVEFVDPVKNPELEEEAAQKYGIEPVPFQVAGRYESSIVSSYFNVLVKYGNEYQVLGFRDLITVKSQSQTDIDVQLRNPEHDLTSAVKSVLQSYQASGNLFSTVQGELTFNAYVSANEQLPDQLVSFKESVKNIVGDYREQSDGRLSVNFIDPEAGGGQVAQRIAEEYGFQPMSTSLLSNDRFYFYLTLQKNDQVVRIPLGDLTETSFERNLESGIKRFASGFTKTVALVAPEQRQSRFGPTGPSFNQLQNFLSDELNVVSEDISDGRVSGQADILLLAAPKGLDDKAVFAVDQFLMQGGTVIAATSPFSARFGQNNLSLREYHSGLGEWLQHHGLTVEKQVVMDPQSASFPVPVSRSVGGIQIQEMRMLDYPYFVDIRQGGLNSDHPITADLRQATVPWVSPIQVNSEEAGQRQITELLHSSPQAWLSDSTDIMPRLEQNGVSAFAPEGEQSRHLLGVMTSGRFESFFAGKQSPLLAADGESESDESGDDQTESPADELGAVTGVIEKSPESARIVLVSSNDFLRDDMLGMISSTTGSEYLNTLQLVANAVDYSLEGTGLMSIRSRGYFSRTLPPMDQQTQMFWEYLNYALAAIALALVALIQRQRRKARDMRYLQNLAQ